MFLNRLNALSIVLLCVSLCSAVAGAAEGIDPDGAATLVTVTIVDERTAEVVFEHACSGQPLQMTLPAGSYQVRVARDQGTEEQSIELSAGATVEVVGSHIRLIGAGDSVPRESARPSESGLPIADLAGTEEAKLPRARAELAIGQTINGLTLGLELAFAADFEDTRGFVASIAVGGGIGLTAALLASRGGVRPGQSLLLNSGAAWGALNGAWLSLLIDADSDGVGLTMFLSQLAGTGIGLGLIPLWNPREGDVALANTGAIWASTIAAFAMGTQADEVESEVWGGVLFGSTVAGLVGGGLVSHWFPMSRSRTLLIDAGALVGGMLGLGTVVLIDGTEFELPAFFGAGIAGIVVGGALATFFTRNWDAPALKGSLGIAPTRDGGLLTYSIYL